MAKKASGAVDSRFVVDDAFAGEAAAESSQSPRQREVSPDEEDHEDHEEDASNEISGASEGEGEEEGSDGEDTDLADGMDPAGFSGPSAVVKPLTKEALAVSKAAHERTGVLYISRIPPGMRPTKVRHLMSTYGEIGRVYLQQEGATIL